MNDSILLLKIAAQTHNVVSLIICYQSLIKSILLSLLQVAAQTGHSVFVVDLSKEILSKAEERIKTSLQRVAKKTFAEDPKVGILRLHLCLWLDTI